MRGRSRGFVGVSRTWGCLLSLGGFVKFRGIYQSGGILGLRSLMNPSGLSSYPCTPLEESGVARGLETHEGPPHPHQEVGCPSRLCPTGSTQLWFG